MHSYHYTQWLKTKSFPSEIRSKTRMHAFTTSIEQRIEILYRDIFKKNKLKTFKLKASKIIIVHRLYDPICRKPQSQ